MKKLICLFACVLLCFTSACSQSSEVGDKETESSPSSETGDKETEKMEILASGKYYCVYKEILTTVRYEIYNAKGDTVLRETTDRPLRIEMRGDHIVDIAIGMGTGLAVHKYYDANNDVFSEEYSYVACSSEDLVAYIGVPEGASSQDSKLVVQNIFDKSLFYKEFELEFGFRVIDFPIRDAEFSKDGTSLRVTYLPGEGETPVTADLSLIQ